MCFPIKALKTGWTLDWTGVTSSRASEKLVFFSPTLDQVSLRLFFLPRAVRDFFFFLWDLWKAESEKPARQHKKTAPSQPRTCSFNSSLTYLSFPPEHSSPGRGRAERWDRSTSQIGVPSLFLKPPGGKVSFHSNGDIPLCGSFTEKLKKKKKRKN